MQYEGRRKPLPKRGFTQRYPRIFILMGTTLAMCIIFSKPIYDVFFAKPPENVKKIALPDRV